MTPRGMAGMNKFGWTVCVLCPTLKFMPHKIASLLASRPDEHDLDPYDTYTDPYDTHNFRYLTFTQALKTLQDNKSLHLCYPVSMSSWIEVMDINNVSNCKLILWLSP